jgi:hypothetical protein
VNAPPRPQSAYFTFAGQIRSRHENKNKRFVDLAKETGELWREVSPRERAAREAEATFQTKTYNARFQEYFETDEYKLYHRYLVGFEQYQSTRIALGPESSVTGEVNPSTWPANIISAAEIFDSIKRTNDESDMPLMTVIKRGSEGNTPTTKAWSIAKVIMTLVILVLRIASSNCCAYVLIRADIANS